MNPIAKALGKGGAAQAKGLPASSDEPKKNGPSSTRMLAAKALRAALASDDDDALAMAIQACCSKGE